MANLKKAGVGSSFKMKEGMPEPIALSKAHKSGKTAATWNASRMDRLERQKAKGTGGVRK